MAHLDRVRCVLFNGTCYAVEDVTASLKKAMRGNITCLSGCCDVSYVTGYDRKSDGVQVCSHFRRKCITPCRSIQLYGKGGESKAHYNAKHHIAKNENIRFRCKCCHPYCNKMIYRDIDGEGKTEVYQNTYSMDVMFQTEEKNTVVEVYHTHETVGAKRQWLDDNFVWYEVGAVPFKYGSTSVYNIKYSNTGMFCDGDTCRAGEAAQKEAKTTEEERRQRDYEQWIVSYCKEEVREQWELCKLCMEHFVQSIQDNASKMDEIWLSGLRMSIEGWKNYTVNSTLEPSCICVFQQLWRKVYDYESRYCKKYPDRIDITEHQRMRFLLRKYLHIDQEEARERERQEAERLYQLRIVEKKRAEEKRLMEIEMRKAAEAAAKAERLKERARYEAEQKASNRLVRFQHLDTLYKQGKIYMFGRALDGRSVAVVQEYCPSIIVDTALHKFREMIIGYLCAQVYGSDTGYQRPSIEYLQKRLEGDESPRCELIQGQDLCRYDETRCHTFYKYTFPNTRMYYAARTLLERPSWVAVDNDNDVTMKRFKYNNVGKYNTQVNSGMQYMIERELMSSGVFEFEASPIVTKETTCQLEFHLKEDCVVRPADTKEQAPLHILSYDLECDLRTVNGKLVFPEAEIDPIITIGVVHSSGKAVFCLHETNPIEGVDVYYFPTEKEMLCAFNAFVLEYDPDFIIGHNVNRFDNVYYEKRCIHHSIKMSWSRMMGHACQVKKIVTKSNQKGTREVFRLDLPGRVVLDSYEKFREDHNLRSYKLNELGKHFLKQEKYDMPYAQIPIKFKSVEGRTEIADYCVQDSHLVYELVKSQCKILNTIGLANVTGVTAKDILQRGQGIRTISLMIRYCLRNDPVIFVPKGQNSEHEFKGAVVLPPLRGKYDDAVVCVDFASLYPSIMQAMNMCYSTLVTRPTINRMQWTEDEQVRTVPDYEMGDRLKIIFNPENVSFVTTDVREGILPKILNDVLNERRAVKKEMKAHYGTPYYGVLNGRQLALKVTANSVYGFTGAQKGYLPEPRIASSVTKYGRGLTLRTMDMVDNNPDWKGSKVIYGDSVTYDTPLLVRVRGVLMTCTIAEVAERDGATWEQYGDKERAPLEGVEVWSDKKDTFGWTKVHYVIRHKTEKQIYRVVTTYGYVDVTEDHSLLSATGEEIKPDDLHTDGVVHDIKLMVSRFPVEPESTIAYNYQTGYDIGSSLFHGGEGLFSMDKQRSVPKEMLTAPIAAVHGLLQGVFDTTDWCTDTRWKELMLGIAYCAQRAGWEFVTRPAPYDRGSHGLYRFTLRVPNHTNMTSGKQPKLDGKVLHVYPIGKSKKPVYDLTTESHHFAVGPGHMIVHNTDSCFIHLSREICDGEDSKALVEKAHEVGEVMANEITKQFLQPVLMEYENAFEPPFYLLKKKRYMGKRVLPGRDPKVYIKGCECIRRDFAPIVVETQREMIDLLLDNKVDDAIQLVQKTYTDLYAGRTPLKKLILCKKLAQLPEEYKSRMPHVELAKRLQKERPEIAPVAGDRVEYVIRTGREQLFERAIAPDEVDKHTVDYAYYAEKQLKEPLARIMDLVCDVNQLFPHVAMTAAVNKNQLKRLGIVATKRAPKRRKITKLDIAMAKTLADKDIRKFFTIKK